MKSIQTIGLFLGLLLLASCRTENKQITNPNDYQVYLEQDNQPSVVAVEQEISFWTQKYAADTTQSSFLSQIAANYAKLFEITGNIQYLYQTEALLLKYNAANHYSSSGPIRSLARNYISQHRFKEALLLANQAFALGDGRKETQKLLFDVQMELGDYSAAEASLKVLSEQMDFDYLIRKAKWSDHQGDLTTAIECVAEAGKKAELNENRTLKIWTYSNLGDMYGHAGNIKAAYDCYLKTLQLEPTYSYALKGIAWIAFSHEKNPKEANKIIAAISKHYNTPDYYLLKAQIAEFEQNITAKNENLKHYFEQLQQQDYGAMYNKYNTLLFAADQSTVQEALRIAKIEVEHRPTPDSYDLLAWSYYKSGDLAKALAISQKYVEGHTFEPLANYHLAEIYKANQLTQMVPPIKKELLQSGFELGPVIAQQVAVL